METHPLLPVITICAIKVWWLANMIFSHLLNTIGGKTLQNGDLDLIPLKGI
jgi:hypothetical protein